jgi:hypothetical protein
MSDCFQVQPKPAALAATSLSDAGGIEVKFEYSASDKRDLLNDITERVVEMGANKKGCGGQMNARVATGLVAGGGGDIWGVGGSGGGARGVRNARGSVVNRIRKSDWAKR